MMFNVSQENSNKCGIYCIRNLVDETCYIGQTLQSFRKRKNRHLAELTAGIHHNVHLQRAFDKYSSEAFEFTVLEICNDESVISEKEEQYISKYRKDGKCYNVLPGGPSMNGENNPFYGKHHSTETLCKLSELKKGKYSGEKNNFYGQDHSGEKNGFWGHKHSEEARQKMSEKKKELFKDPRNNPFYGKKHSAETLEKFKNNGKNAMKSVICIETDMLFPSIKDAAAATGVCARSISAVCCGKRNTAGKLHWKYA